MCRILCFSVVLFFSFISSSYAVEVRCKSDISLLPMYGGCAKPAQLEKADQALVDGVRQAGVSPSAASQQAARKGFAALLQSKDYVTSIKRFNQAWLLDKNNGDAYYGFAMIAWLRDKDIKAAEGFFQESIGKNNADNSMLMSYAQFLFSQSRVVEAITPLEKLLQRYPASEHVNPMLAFAHAVKNKGKNQQSCAYAMAAVKKKEKLLQGTIKDYCN